MNRIASGFRLEQWSLIEAYQLLAEKLHEGPAGLPSRVHAEADMPSGDLRLIPWASPSRD